MVRKILKIGPQILGRWRAGILGQALSGFFDLYGFRTVVAEWLGIVAAFASVYAAVAIARIKSQILGRVRLPSLKADIAKSAKEISERMSEYENSRDQIGLELAKCESNLKLLLKNLKGQPRLTARELIRCIRIYKGTSRPSWLITPAVGTKADAWKIYEQLNVLTNELKFTIDEQRIGG